VGVGQSEGDVAQLVDTLVYVAQPGAGDLLQFMKAGVLELPDLFVVNKADLGAEAARTCSELQAGVGLGERDPVWAPPVVLVSARDGTGLEELEAALASHLEALEASGALDVRRRAGRDAFVVACLEQRYGSYGTEVLGGECAIRKRLEAEPEASGFALADDLAREIEEGVSRGRTGGDGLPGTGAT
jgi:LAO/AO transport system kinase